MKIQDQVCSLELSNKLKELGVKQESLYCWLEASDGARLMTNPANDSYKFFEQSSAFTVAEIGEMLPSRYKQGKYNGKYYAEHYEDNFDLCEGSDTEANARAKMLVYLLETNLIKP